MRSKLAAKSLSKVAFHYLAHLSTNSTISLATDAHEILQLEPFYEKTSNGLVEPLKIIKNRRKKKKTTVPNDRQLLVIASKKQRSRK